MNGRNSVCVCTVYLCTGRQL